MQTVVPMLPRLLCEQLCGLNPGVERLTFSVVWDMAPDGRVAATWAGRSVIRSCAKLAYGHAQVGAACGQSEGRGVGWRARGSSLCAAGLYME